MSFEQLWYSSFRDGERPIATRYSRMPTSDAWTFTIDLAIDYAAGRAGYRHGMQTAATREKFWFWPHPKSPTGWWLIPDRIHQRVLKLRADAFDQVARETGSATPAEIVSVLKAWRRTRVWRRHVQSIVPRHPLSRKATGSRHRRQSTQEAE